MDINLLLVISFANTFSNFTNFSFCCFLCCAKTLIRPHLFIFTFISFVLGNRFKKYHYNIHQRVPPLFSSGSFMFSGLTFMSVINFEFVCLFFNVRKCPNFIVLHVAVQLSLGFHHSLVGKEFACSAGDLGFIPGLERSPGEGNSNPPKYSCLENTTIEEPGRL